ncbi:hypothetical protein GKE82_04975 [Conexibacter sp. W3-3-2]|uniref:hypothetical protein n=1 Tax=Conexibacter sp. W3-3-2 TaxID=2675227 RepID=UPI0012B746A0|nr:hypothetical protein [Conexibacter sp. W3-3-2]MTD43674.1 hypothetical protein [Conexibacter sp. W3-3-2]
MFVTAMAVLVACSLAIPHRLSLSRVRPQLAIAVWSSALVLRAALALGAAVFTIRFLPATEAFTALTHWCWHTALPGLSTHLGLDGHTVGDIAIVLPIAMLAFSLVSVGHGLVRASRAVSGFVRGSAVGPGPDGSVIVGQAGVLVAAAGLARPRIIVSPMALAVLDEPELRASLDHERGHVVRRHRYLLLLAELLRAVGRVVPGAHTCVREIQFHLERDADRWAIARGGDRLALASAICKAAEMRPATGPALTALSGSTVAARVRELMDGGDEERDDRSAWLLAGWLALLALAFVALLPAAALSPASAAVIVQHCV